MTRLRTIAMSELLWVIVVVLIILIIATGYYTQALDRAARTRAEVSAGSLEKTASVVRAVWTLRAEPARHVDFGGWRYRVNAAGWPLDAHPLGDRQGLAESACGRLWQSLISAPNSATVKERKGPESLVWGPSGNYCRYRWPESVSGELEYRPGEGKVRVVSE